MNKKEREQLERFFQHNPVEDSLYLKKYVREHPDHKMAWYLLGREYAAQGKTGKAAYCFEQSGEIYEAFEKQKIRIERDPELNESTHKRTSRFKKWLLIAGLLLFLTIPASISTIQDKDQTNESESIETNRNKSVSEVVTIKETSRPELNLSEQDGVRIHYLTDSKASNDWMPVLKQMVLPTEEKWKKSLLIGAERTTDGQWVQWYKPAKILLGVERSGESPGQSLVHYYDKNSCLCEPSDPSRVKVHADNWQKRKEEALVLYSAISAYRQQNGNLPESIAQLHKPYPNNLLSGATQAMLEMFPSLVNEQSTMPDPAAGSSPNPAKQPSDNGGSVKQQLFPFDVPLQIIVDKDKHVLNVVSGSFIIRSYPVGLGGAKTLEGEFVISEKVRNPNGKSNGEFGSRGMTLSDTLYAIHGTNQPASIGKDQSKGCIRMLQADLEELFDMVPKHTKVTIGKGLISESVKGGENRVPTFHIPPQTEESNPNKIYKWLN